MLEEDIPKLNKSGIDLKVLYRSLKKLENNPYGSSRAKSGDLSGIRGMDWNKGYRVLFKINDDKKLVTIVSIDNHDNAYKKAKKRID
ncbi:MAG: hypothetical protein PHV37_04310 [Candidatus Gastranaerophilales bacterium]|nr:hypothetical protein [Candidatus Gastranaerophilales bacterium]